MKLEQINGFDLYLRDSKDLDGYYRNGEYEPEETAVIYRLLKKNWICMDIGANIGYFTVFMAKRCKYVYAFEPEPSNFEMLEINTKINRLDNVHLYQEAVTDVTGKRPLYLSNYYGMHRMYESKHCVGYIDVHAIRLDDYKFPKIDFIKIDIEGAEMGALQGMVELLVKDKPVILMEFHPPSIEEYGIEPRCIYAFMSKLGYDIYLIPFLDHDGVRICYNDPISYDKLFDETNNVRGGQNILAIVP